MQVTGEPPNAEGAVAAGRPLRDLRSSGSPYSATRLSRYVRHVRYRPFAVSLVWRELGPNGRGGEGYCRRSIRQRASKRGISPPPAGNETSDVALDIDRVRDAYRLEPHEDVDTDMRSRRLVARRLCPVRRSRQCGDPDRTNRSGCGAPNPVMLRSRPDSRSVEVFGCGREVDPGRGFGVGQPRGLGLAIPIRGEQVFGLFRPRAVTSMSVRSHRRAYEPAGLPEAEDSQEL